MDYKFSVKIKFVIQKWNYVVDNYDFNLKLKDKKIWAISCMKWHKNVWLKESLKRC